MFTRSVTDELAGLVSQVEESLTTHAEEKLAAFLVLMTDDPKDSIDGLKELAAREELSQLPLTIYSGSSGPKDYHISDDYDVTIVMWDDNEVRSNHVFRQANLTGSEIEAVMEGVKELVARQ